MPLSFPNGRREIHQRVIDMKAYERDDGLYDVEAHLVDRKPFTTEVAGLAPPVPAGQARHDLSVRLTVDSQYVVRAIEAASDVTPYGVCKEAEASLSVMLGVQIAPGWSVKVKELLRGPASCTHLMELLIPLGTTAWQGIGGLNSDKKRAAVDADGIPRKLDTCYAYGRSSEVVKFLWPQHFRPRGPDLPNA
ncbi:MAG TPA: DUF2889 domain-containing protein [Ramlibacter sp.]|nr:DUF2889 domain-containing protein [Ramlibacter sp.]